MNRCLILLLGVLLVLAWTRPLAAADAPYDLYTLLPLTGAAAFLGRDEVPPINAFEKYINANGGIHGRPLHVIVQDDQSNPTVAIQLANQIIAKGVPAFMGPAFGATCGAVTPLVEAHGPVVYCLTSVGQPQSDGYVFVYGVTNRDFIANALRYLKAKGVRTLALLETTDASGLDGTASAEEAVKEPDLRDLKIVAVEDYAPTDLSVMGQMARIKASGADAVINYVTGPAFGTALHAINQVGYHGWVFTAASNGSKVQMDQYKSFMPRKLLFGTLGYQETEGVPAPVRAAKAGYRDAMTHVGITDPTIGNMVPWDPLMILVDGLRKYGTDVSARQMRAYILGLHDWPGMMGMYDFGRGDQRGVDPRSTGVMSYDAATDSFVVMSKPGGSPLG